MNKFYNSSALARRLKSLKTDCVGTLRLSMKDVRQRVKDKKLKKVELVQALLIEHKSESVRKFQDHHSTDKNVPCLVKRHFPERIPLTEKKRRGQQRGV